MNQSKRALGIAPSARFLYSVRMAGKDDAGILEAIRDGFARASTEKQVQANTDALKGAMATIEERFSSIERRLKAAETRDEEIVALIGKEFTKLRTHVTDQIETIEAEGGDAEETTEAIEKTVEKYVGEAKGLFKWLVGDDPDTVAALRGRVRDWVGKKGKRALAGGDDD